MTIVDRLLMREELDALEVELARARAASRPDLDSLRERMRTLERRLREPAKKARHAAPVSVL